MATSWDCTQMRPFLLGFLLIMIMLQASIADSVAMMVPATPGIAPQNTSVFHKIGRAMGKKPPPQPADLSDLSSLGAANITDPLVPATEVAASSPVNHPQAPSAVDPEIAQETQGVFHGAKKNLNLYVTQIQCQATGIDTSSCSNQNTTNTSSTVVSNINKFLLNSVTSSLGIGVQVHF